MMSTGHSVVRYAGTFRFADRVVLERALSSARALINEEQDLVALEGGWLRCFVMSETSLTINLALPELPEHRIAAEDVFAVLSQEALEGAVTASIDDAPVENYVVRSTSKG